VVRKADKTGDAKPVTTADLAQSLPNFQRGSA
jgi:hypothetical protein